MKTPNQVSQYLGNKNANLKSGCKTLFLLTQGSQIFGWFSLQRIIPKLLSDGQLTYVNHENFTVEYNHE